MALADSRGVDTAGVCRGVTREWRRWVHPLAPSCPSPAPTSFSRIYREPCLLPSTGKNTHFHRILQAPCTFLPSTLLSTSQPPCTFLPSTLLSTSQPPCTLFPSTPPHLHPHPLLLLRPAFTPVHHPPYPPPCPCSRSMQYCTNCTSLWSVSVRM